ncbi:MAG: hypothetical protein LH630_08320 [Actinomycetia bacterium]|nr:hypothetical protein [Actinomycetes bacterium]
MTDTATVPRLGAGAVVRGLAQYAPRLAKWPMLAAGIAGSWLLVWWRSDGVTEVDGALWLIRGVAALAAVTVVFAFDDPSVDTTRALPVARRALMGVRFAVSAVAVVVAMSPAALVLGQYLNTWSVAVGIALEACAVLVLTTAAALLLQRQLGITEPAQFVLLVVVGLLMVVQMVGQRWPLLVPPGPQWAEAHWRWIAMLALGVLVMVWQLRDPAACPLRRFLRR